MSRLRLLLVLAMILPAALAAHADTITTNHVVLTFTTAPILGITVLPGESPVVLVPAVTQQYNFSFVDGISENGEVVLYTIPETTYSGSTTSGSPSAGSFTLSNSFGTAAFSIATTSFGTFNLSGYSSSPYKSVSDSNGLFTTLFFQPGTYALASPQLSTSQVLGPVVSASYTITQTTTGAAAPVSVTPEPSGLLLLGTGLLGVSGIARRRLSTSTI